MKLLNYVYQVGGISLSHHFDASAYLIEGADGLYLIDCGTPEGFPMIVDNIKKLGFDPQDIRVIYGTHGHYDHVGAASLWKEAYGCKLYLHEIDVQQVETGDSIKTTAELLYGKIFTPCVVEGTVEDGQFFDFGNQITMEVLYTPGHTRGSVSYVLNCAGYIFLVAGDTLWGGFSQIIGSDEKLWKESLNKLTARHFDGYTFGHVGANVIADADARIAEAKRQFATYYNPWFKPMKEDFRYA